GSDLDRLGVNHRLVNIWENPTAAAYVRSIARGNETVPTVSIGRVALVNPSTDDVLATAMQYTPGLVPEGYVPRRTLGNWIRRRLDR
ncbi:MAG: glutaredoxin domain-containing protein, partial [Acidimicrobiia bacterium]